MEIYDIFNQLRYHHEDEVVLNLPGTIIDENYSLLLLENQDMSLTDAVLLDQVQKGKSINDNAIKKLRKA